MLNWKCGSSSLMQCAANARQDMSLLRRHTVPKMNVRKITKDWLAIAIVRHPLTRLQSCWKEKVRDHPNMVVLEHLPNQQPCDFNTFVKCIAEVPDENADLHFRSQHCSMMWNGLPKWDYIVKLEEISDEWPKMREAVFEHSGWQLGDFPHKNQTEGHPAFSPFTLKLAKERYKEDFELFGYSTESYYGG